MRWFFVIALFWLSGNVTDPPAMPDAERVELVAEDGRTLVASFYAPPSDDAPAVLLLHQLYTNRDSWHTVIPHLHAAGYAVLAPDLRGYGETRGVINWRAAQTDTTAWLSWLREHPATRDDALMTMGSSMGANLAVIGCADDVAAHADSGCRATVAISAGRNYFGYTPLAPALETLAERPVLMAAARNDGYAAIAAETLPESAPQVEVWWADGNAHGMDLLDESAVRQIIGWLDAHRP